MFGVVSLKNVLKTLAIVGFLSSCSTHDSISSKSVLEREVKLTEIPKEYHGVWIYDQSGIHPGGEDPESVTAKSINGHESWGRVLAVTRLTNGDLKVDLSILGEGQLEEDALITAEYLRLSEDGKVLRKSVEPDLSSKYVRDLYRCHVIRFYEGMNTWRDIDASEWFKEIQMYR